MASDQGPGPVAHLRLLGRLIRDHSSTKAEVAVMEGLLSHTWNGKWECYPSIPTIAKRSGLSQRSVMRGVAALEQKGYVEVVRSGRSNLYGINFHLSNGDTDVTSDPEVTNGSKPSGFSAQQVTPVAATGDGPAAIGDKPRAQLVTPKSPEVASEIATEIASQARVLRAGFTTQEAEQREAERREQTCMTIQFLTAPLIADPDTRKQIEETEARIKANREAREAEKRAGLRAEYLEHKANGRTKRMATMEELFAKHLDGLIPPRANDNFRGKTYAGTPEHEMPESLRGIGA